MDKESLPYEIQVSPDGVVTVFSPEEREPHMLTVQHIPFATTFAVFESGHLLVLDPTLEEEAASTGAVTIVSNAHDELCGVHKAKGTGLSTGQLMRCVRLGNRRAQLLGADLRAALDVHKVQRVQSRIKRRAGSEAAVDVSYLAASAASVAGTSGIVSLPVGGVAEASEPLLGMSLLKFEEEPASRQPASSESNHEMDASMENLDETDVPEQSLHAEPPRARLLSQEGSTKKKKKRKSSGTDGRGVKRPGVPETAVDQDPGFDEFSAIAAMIAGAPLGQQVASLADSIKAKAK